MIYVHVPFCKSRCLYCDFFSSTWAGRMEEYVSALIAEMDARADDLRLARANTLYIGGGTPSQLSADQLLRIFSHLHEVVPLEAGAEVTLECNPDDVSPEWVAAMRRTPINRISMGMQTTDDALLRLLNRRHTSAQAFDAVEMLRQAGYTNLSLDLMYGLPGQTMEMWEADVQALLSMQVPHLSAYALQWEEGTALYRMMERGEVAPADEELSLAMYRHLCRATREAGMEHYEISNFAMPQMRARHNSGYWRNEPYVGLGPGAHSYDGGRLRRSNPSDLALYIQMGGCPEPEVEHLNEGEWYEEQILKGLRTSEGVDLGALSQKYRDYALEMVAPHVQSGHATLHGNVLHLTEEGIFVSSDIMADLML